MIQEVEIHRADLVALCRRYEVRRLEVFGSAASGRFDPARSDVDFLVEFSPPLDRGYADRYFGLLEDLTGLFGRRVDLVVESAIKNRYFREVVEQTRTPVYGA